MRMLFKISIILVIGAFLFWHFMPNTKGGNDVASTSVDRLSVSTIKPIQKTSHSSLKVIGNSIPRNDIAVTTELAGLRAVEILSDIGDQVRAGQTLAVLDTKSQVNQLAQIDSDYEKALDEFNRADSIKDTGAISKEVFVQKRSAMNAAKARLEEAKLSLRRGKVLASSDGIIYERNINVGEIAGGDSPLFRIIGNNEVEIEADVPENDLSKLSVGQIAKISLAAQEEVVEGKIRLISPQVDQLKRTAKIRIALSKEAAVPVGAFATVEINLAEISGVSIPSTTLQEDEKGTFVWAIKANGAVTRHSVTVKQRLTDEIMIEPIGDALLVARAGSFVKEGEIVNPVNEARQ